MSTTKPRQQINEELLIYPDPSVPAECLLIKREPNVGVGVFFSNDSGKTFRRLIIAPNKNDRVGSVLTILPDGSVGWQFLQAPDFSSGPQVIFVQFQLVGDLYDGAIFGKFTVPSGKTLALVEMQATLQDAADDSVILDMVDSSGLAQGKTLSITTSETSSRTVFSTKLKMPSLSSWSIKVLQAGNTLPGQNINVTIGLNYQ